MIKNYRLQRMAVTVSSMLALLLAGAGCGKNATVTLRVVTPPGAADPIASATRLRMTLDDHVSEVDVSGGKFNINLEIESPASDKYVQLQLDALDASKQIIGHGRTPNFVLTAAGFDLAVYVGRPGQVTATELVLPDDLGSVQSPQGRRELLGTTLRGRQVTPMAEAGLGALLVGGAVNGGKLASKAWLYKPLTHQLVDAGTPQTPRRGGVLLASADGNQGQQALAWGGLSAANDTIATAEKFDPAVSALSLVWAAPEAAYADAGAPGAYLPQSAEIQDSTYVVCGGTDAKQNPLAQAVLLRRNPAPAMSGDTSPRLGVTRIPPRMDGTGPMVVARSEHTATAVTTADGAGALIFGGLSVTDSNAKKPVAELYLADKNTFAPLSFVMPEPASRRGHVAFKLKSGRVLIAGGYSEDGAGNRTADDSAVILDVGARTAESRPKFLKTARYGASIAAVKNDLVICGGVGTAGAPLSDCELFSLDGTPLPDGQVVPLPTPRAYHLMLPLENDLAILVGGITTKDGVTAPTLDIYTAR